MKKFLKLGLGVTFAFIMMLSLTGCGNTENKSNNDGGNTSTQNEKQNEKENKDEFNWSKYLSETYDLKLSFPDDMKIVRTSKIGNSVYLTIDYGTKGYDAMGTIIFDELKKIAKSDIYGDSDRTWTYSSFKEANEKTYGYVGLHTDCNNGESIIIGFSPKSGTTVEVSFR